MSFPTPPFDLVNHCTTVWKNSLYVYSPSGFASLPLEQDAQWQELDAGESVTGGLCVPALTPGIEALFIVGGTDAAGSASNYTGLQRYDLNANTWETITPTSAITQNRIKHGASFVNTTSSIVVYSGTQDATASGLGQQTFVIGTQPPYDVTSFNAQGAPALTSPMVMQWSEDQVVLIGGAADNTEVWLFGQAQGWTNLGTTLPAGLALDSASTQCTIVSGADGSKVLEVYNLAATPNLVTRYVLFANNAAAPAGQQVAPPGAASTTAAQKRNLRFRRALTIADWPAYNSTLAPNTTRSGFSLALDPNGLAVISGGGSNDDPVALFNQESNTWMNSTSFFVKDQVPLTATTTSSSSAAASSTIPPVSSIVSSAPVASSTGVLGTGQSKSKLLTTLGATLGAIFGLAAILIIILLLLRWKKLKMRRAAGGINEKDQDRMSFADQGADFMKEAGGARGLGYSGTKSANSSLTSLQIFQNKSLGHRRGMPSDSSVAPLSKNKSPLGVSEPMEMSQMSQRSSPTFTTRSLELEKPEYAPAKPTGLTPASAVTAKDAKDGRTRSNGWSRYFANNDVTNLASMQSGGRNTYNTEISDMSKSSDYDDRSKASSIPPLELNLGPKFESQRLSAVNTGSPTMGQSTEDIQEGLSAEIRRAGSTSSRGSDVGFEFSSGPTPATQSTWTPSNNKGDTRSIASNYSSGSNPFFGSTSELDPRPRKGSNGAPAMPQLNLRNYGDASRDSQGSAVTVFPSGFDSPKAHAFPSSVTKSQPSRQNEYDLPAPRNYFGEQHRDSGASNVTVFPGAPVPTPASNYGRTASPAPRTGPNGRKLTATEDMGWLNLNDGRGV